MVQDTSRQGAEWLRQTTAGALLIAAGVILLMAQQGVIRVVSVWRYWPVALIVAGLMKLVIPRSGRDLGTGVLELVAGTWCLACNFHWFGFTYWETWPFIFVAIGANIVIKALMPSQRSVRPADTGEDFHA